MVPSSVERYESRGPAQEPRAVQAGEGRKVSGFQKTGAEGASGGSDQLGPMLPTHQAGGVWEVAPALASLWHLDRVQFWWLEVQVKRE